MDLMVMASHAFATSQISLPTMRKHRAARAKITMRSSSSKYSGTAVTIQWIPGT